MRSRLAACPHGHGLARRGQLGVPHVVPVEAREIILGHPARWSAHRADAQAFADFYHSSCPQPGIAGLAEVASDIETDPTQFDPNSPYFDAKSSPDAPRWQLRHVKAVRKTRLVSLAELREHPELADMLVLKRGNRLSITPVTPQEWECVLRLVA